MTWRGSTTTTDRILACLPYLWLLVEILSIGAGNTVRGFMFGIPIVQQFDWLDTLLLPLKPLVGLYVGVVSLPFAKLMIFFLIYFAIVRNPRIVHFIRFSAMQVLLIDIAIFALSLFLALANSNFINQAFLNGIFLVGFAVFCYGVFQTLLGKYAEIPPISDAVYIHVRD